MSNILYVTNSGLPGGMEKHVLDLVVGMVKFGHNVHVWCPDGIMANLYERAGAKVVRKRINLELDPFYILDLVKYLRANSIEVIHGHELKAASNALIAGMLSGVKIRIAHTHTPISTWRVSLWQKIPSRVFYPVLVNLIATKEIALSESVKEIKVKEGISSEKLEVVPNGIDLKSLKVSDSKKREFRNEIRSRYNIQERAFVFGNISRLSAEKGHDLLVAALANLRDQEAILLVAGSGVLEGKLRELSKEKGVKDRVVFTGVYEDDAKKRLLSALDLLVFPSYAEGFGYVVAEAMGFGTPVLASDLEVLKEVGGVTIEYFKTGSLKDLVEGIDRINGSGYSSQNIENARNRVHERFSMEAFWTSYDRLYQARL